MICISVGSWIVMEGGHCCGVAQLLLKCWLQVNVQKTGWSGQLLDPARPSNVIRRGDICSIQLKYFLRPAGCGIVYQTARHTIRKPPRGICLYCWQIMLA